MAGLSAYASYQLGAGSIGDEINALVSAGKVRRVGIVSTLPPGIPEVTLDQLRKQVDPWYKKWWVWAIAGTTVTGGALFYWRRRRK